MNSASTVLRGAGAQLMYGRDIVAPPGNQAANGEHKHRPAASGGPSLLDRRVCQTVRSGGGLSRVSVTIDNKINPASAAFSSS